MPGSLIWRPPCIGKGECYGFTLNGGSYLRSKTEVLENCKRYDFNMTALCNNHTMDYAYEGLIKTMEHVDRSGLVHTGAGRNVCPLRHQNAH